MVVWEEGFKMSDGGEEVRKVGEERRVETLMALEVLERKKKEQRERQAQKRAYDLEVRRQRERKQRLDVEDG
jgi:hypothetical protein